MKKLWIGLLCLLCCAVGFKVWADGQVTANQGNPGNPAAPWFFVVERCNQSPTPTCVFEVTPISNQPIWQQGVTLAGNGSVTFFPPSFSLGTLTAIKTSGGGIMEIEENGGSLNFPVTLYNEIGGGYGNTISTPGENYHTCINSAVTALIFSETFGQPVTGEVTENYGCEYSAAQANAALPPKLATPQPTAATNLPVVQMPVTVAANASTIIALPTPYYSLGILSFTMSGGSGQLYAWQNTGTTNNRLWFYRLGAAGNQAGGPVSHYTDYVGPIFDTYSTFINAGVTAVNFLENLGEPVTGVLSLTYGSVPPPSDVLDILSNTYAVTGSLNVGSLPTPTITPTPYPAVSVDVTSSGASTLVTGISGKSLDILRLDLIFGGATTWALFDSSGVTYLLPTSFTPGSSYCVGSGYPPIFSTTSGANLLINSSNAVDITGSVNYATH